MDFLLGFDGLQDRLFEMFMSMTESVMEQHKLAFWVAAVVVILSCLGIVMMLLVTIVALMVVPFWYCRCALVFMYSRILACKSWIQGRKALDYSQDK
jgi:protein-S-isoprenylcysteine O-methyltransferase Ste14